VGVVTERTDRGTWEHAVIQELCRQPELDVVSIRKVAGSRTDAGGRARGALVGRIEGALDRVGEGEGGPGVAARGDVGVPDVLLDLTAGDVPAGGRTWWFRFGPRRGVRPADAIADAALAGATTFEVALESAEGPARVGVFELLPYGPWSSAAAAAGSFTMWPAMVAAAVARGDGAPLPHGALPAFAGDASPAPAPVRRLAPARLAARATRELARRALWAEVWTVGVAPVTPDQVVAARGLPGVTWLRERGPAGLRSLVEPQAFAADPFLYADGERTVCLFEALDYGSNRGWIAAVDLPAVTTPEGKPDQRTVFQNEWHWSYPFVLVDGGETYCIPETADAGGVLLHRLTDAGFEQEADLLPGLAVLDPTIVRHDRRYWLFCTRRDGPLLNTELHLFVADELTGPYRPHRHNPVKVDIRSARPAGTIFAIDGVLHRPGQDCGREYGAALVIHRIDELSDEAFRETPVAVLRPQPPYGAGLHTLSFGGGWAAIDAKRHAFSPRLLGTQVAKVLRHRR